MSRPKLPTKSRRVSIGITLSPKALKLGLDAARKSGVSFSEVVNIQLLKLPKT